MSMLCPSGDLPTNDTLMEVGGEAAAWRDRLPLTPLALPLAADTVLRRAAPPAPAMGTLSVLVGALAVADAAAAAGCAGTSDGSEHPTSLSTVARRVGCGPSRKAWYSSTHSKCCTPTMDWRKISTVRRAAARVASSRSQSR